MVCPKCLHTKTQVYNSRGVGRTNQIWRRRRCMHCHFVFSTREYIETEQYLQVAIGRHKVEPFSRIKLLMALGATLTHSEQEPDSAFYLLGTIEQKLLRTATNGIITPTLIITTCLEVLQRFDTKAYLKYLATYPSMHDDRDLRKLLKRKPIS